MSDLVVQAEGLRKTYRRGLRSVVAVDGLDLQVPAGGVHGFLGRNGSGKTTTLRMLVGLTRPSAGSIRVLGRPVPQSLPEVSDRVGAVVDDPGFAPRLSGRRNLQLLGRTLGLSRTGVDEVIASVGLESRARSPYRSYSPGIRQRLAIAAALLKTPDLLILDEATSSMGPEGLHATRDLVRRLGESGVTVLMASHQLAEIQQLCHEVTIIDRGRVVATGPVDQLLGADVSRTRIGVADARGAEHVLRRAGHDVERDDEGLLVRGHRAPEELTRLLAERGHYVNQLTEVRPDLEAVFLRLTDRARQERAEDAEEGS